MKKLNFLICLFLSLHVACKSSQKPSLVDSGVATNELTNDSGDSLRKADSLKTAAQKAAFKSYKLNSTYSVIDTGWFNCGTMEGLYAIVKQNGQNTDTIHLGIGMQEIESNQYLYLMLTQCKNSFETEQPSPGILYLRPYQYVISSTEKRYLLDTAITGFDSYKSAPNVINKKIYFWQYIKQSDNLFNVNAAVYNPETGKTVSRNLFTNDLNDNEHIYPPFEKDRKVIFDWGNKSWKFSFNDFQLLN
ncbi:hypothetical protein EOD41_01710 [Mucilaginibacter limnophilus]|uniref:Uncharacterized protein n=1 Tax=Mucilaginibacter limnophilus TaxID=1932778 RepID=A0A3S2UNC8_9SPHI|nr:hypothetical protein [Mucilaginibacter limnophilus]RVU02680.1 hypothetical protein EOD41_01710 [Mucilaginibacter limnophilus]